MTPVFGEGLNNFQPLTGEFVLLEGLYQRLFDVLRGHAAAVSALEH